MSMDAVILLASQVTHVVVDAIPSTAPEPFYIQERFWVGLSALFSAAVALATYRLGAFTRTLANETRDLATETADSVKAAGFVGAS